MAWDDNYKLSEQKQMFNDLKKLKEQQQRAANAQYVMRLSNMNPQTMGGYIVGGLLGDSINRWLNRKGNDNPYETNEGKNAVQTVAGVIQGNPQDIRNAINDVGGLLGNGIDNAANIAQGAIGNAMQNVDGAGLVNNFANLFVGNAGEGASGLFNAGANLVGDAAKGMKEAIKSIPLEDLFKNWGSN